MLHLSRSAITTYLNCRTKYYLNYLFDVNGQKGIVPVSSAMHLCLGIHVHLGVQYIFNTWIENDTDYVFEYLEQLMDNAVTLAKKAYVRATKQGILGKLNAEATTYDKAMEAKAEEFTRMDQLALLEALIRLWAIQELPTLLNNFNILACEQDMHTALSPEVTFSGRVDAILESKDGKDVFNYNLKTTKYWTEKTDNTFSIDLQSLTETAVVNSNFKSQGKDTRVKGTRFAFLVKGRREKDKATGFLRVANPFTQGYKLPTNTGIEYAYWYYYPNPEGGMSRLGARWVKFDVTEYVGGIKQWVRDIVNKKLQPELNSAHFLDKWAIPKEKYPAKEDVKLAIAQIKAIAFEILAKIKYPGSDQIPIAWVQNKDCCYWPEDCEYLPICHGRIPFSKERIPPVTDPIGSGLYQIRIPHHDEE